jgi:hypothetical protein
MADYYLLISRAIGALDKKSKEARHALYDRAREILADRLKRADPPLSETKLEHERLALEDAIGKVEGDAARSEATWSTILTYFSMPNKWVAQKEQITRTFGLYLVVCNNSGWHCLRGQSAISDALSDTLSDRYSRGAPWNCLGTARVSIFQDCCRYPSRVSRDWLFLAE